MLLNTLLGRIRRTPPDALDVVVEEPRSPLIERRLQRFAGRVRSRAPIADLRFTFDGIEQTVHRYDADEPDAADGKRYVAHWTFHHEVGAQNHGQARDLVLEGLVGTVRVVRTSYRSGKPDDRPGPLLMIPHIPKTAGTSLRLALERQPAIRMVNLYYDRAFMPLSDCDKLTTAAWDDVDVVFGHFPYNMHRISHRPYEYMTVLRHPADLLKSYYLFNKYLVRDAGYQQYSSIEQAIEACTDKTYDNIITRFLASKTTHDPVTDEDFALALSNMERDFSYVGTSEAMQASLDAIGSRLGVELEPYVVNVTPPSAEGDNIDRAWLLRRFASSVAYDLRLYERACELFASGPRAVACSRSSGNATRAA